jgi:hypothetical protein
MYCPRCGQQASEEVRFCSRCGLPLDDAAALVEAGGRISPRDDDAHADALALTPRQRGTRKGLLIMAGGLLFFALALALMSIKEDFFVLMLPAALVFTFGVMRMLYGLLLEDDAARRKSPKLAAADSERTRAKLSRGARDAAAQLPHARTRPASDFAARRAETSDMAPPTSVTDATTALLEKDS